MTPKNAWLNRFPTTPTNRNRHRARIAYDLFLATDILKLGEDQWQLQECYNCHKLKGEGGKKRGPELDNIGSYLTVADIKQKILDPKSWMAEGFEKEYEKGKMPDKYKDLMEEKDVVALASWLVTFKNTSVNTPKPIKMK